MSEIDVGAAHVAGPPAPSNRPAPPASDRTRPTRVHLGLLLAASAAAPLGTVLISPVLPRIGREFAGTPGVDVLVPLVLTAPMLVIALLAPFAGVIVDRLNRRRVLVTALLAYGVVGVLPVWLDSLGAILVSRLVLGLFEGTVMTCSSALIGVMWTGARRTRYLGLQILVAALAATAFVGIGGALGTVSWRAPFVMYAAMILLGLATAALLPEPPRSAPGAERRLPPLRWRRVLAPVGISLPAGAWFYLLLVQLPFLLTDAGVTDSGTIGAVVAAMSVMTAAGAVSVSRVAGRSPGLLLAVEFGLIAVGLVIVGLAGTSVPLIVAGAMITGFGAGMLFPTLLSWTLNRLDPEQRGRGSGFWYTSSCLGQFLSALVVAGVAALVGGLQTAVTVLGVAAALAAALCLVYQRGSTERLDTTTAHAA